ncbi:cuticle protein 7-like [Anabrus simplex]|uniref:cuticle protein 7-like n=1 Tax=Anabrus simplex TaxID=316456 RepID=UPI0035A35EA4
MAFKLVVTLALLAVAHAIDFDGLAYHYGHPAYAGYASGPALVAAPAYAAAPAYVTAARAPAVAVARPVVAPAPVVAARAPAVAVAAPSPVREEPYDPNPQYSYGYSVQDALTGDAKSHHETRNGDVVEGSYSVVESDGSIRTVDYAADSVSGFNAVVRREPGVAPPPVAPAPVARAVVAAPAATRVVAAPAAAAPVAVAAPASYATRLVAAPAPVAVHAAPYPYNAYHY